MEQKAAEHNQLIAGSLLIIATVCFTIALKYTSTVLIPFVLAIFLFYLISPLINLLNLKFQTPRLLAVLLSFILITIFPIIIPFLGKST